MSRSEPLLPTSDHTSDNNVDNNDDHNDDHNNGNNVDNNVDNNDGNDSDDTTMRESMLAGPFNASVFFGSVANLCSATLGAGILALPFAFYQAGLVCGLLLLFLSGWATCASIRLLVHVCHVHSIATYEQVVEHVLGKRGRKLVEYSIIIFCIGCAVGYIIAVGDIVQQVLSFPMSKSTKSIFTTCVWACAMLPLSSLRRMKSLECASTVGITSIGILLLAATVHLLENDYRSERGSITPNLLDAGSNSTTIHRGTLQSLEHYIWPANSSWQSVLRACPIVFFAFSCQVNVCQIYDEMPQSTNDAARKNMMNMVALASVSMCSFLYSSISLVTLIDFGSGILPNILSCYSTKTANMLLHVAFGAMAIAVVMAYPLNIFPARVSISHMIHKSRQEAPEIDDERRTLIADDVELDAENIEDSDENVDEISADEEEAMSDWEHYGLTFVISAGTLLLALILPNISVVFGLLGGTTSSLLGFVLPGLLGIYGDTNNELAWNDRLSAWILVVAGTVVGILTTGVTVYSTIQELVE